MRCMMHHEPSAKTLHIDAVGEEANIIIFEDEVSHRIIVPA